MQLQKERNLQKGPALSAQQYLIIRILKEICIGSRGEISVSSLRADSVSEVLIKRLSESGHKTIAIAPEAGSERLRRVIKRHYRGRYP